MEPRKENFFALDAENGKPLWDFQLGAAIRANPMSFAIDGKQYVAIAAGSGVVCILVVTWMIKGVETQNVSG